MQGHFGDIVFVLAAALKVDLSMLAGNGKVRR
jgi:hypothetical protein